nr:hypothetical protein [Treponema sp.]
YQINTNVKFNRNEDFLMKAEKLTPVLKVKTVEPIRLVETIKDNTKQGGIWIKDSSLNVKELSNIAFKRGMSFILDFGEHYTGYFSIEIDSTGSHQDSPLTLFMRFAEIPAELDADSNNYDGWLSKSWIQEETLHLDKLPERLELKRRYSFRYVKIQVIDTSPKWQAVFSSPLVRAESSATLSFDEKRFSNDEMLQKICEVSRKTLAECMQSVFEDGPKRDRRLWLGDLRLQALSAYETFGAKELVKRCLYLFASVTAEDGRIAANIFTRDDIQADDTFLFDYTLFFPCIIYNYIEHFSDKELISDLYPVAKKAMDNCISYIDEEGKLSLDENYPVFIDWSSSFDKTSAAEGVFIYSLKRFIYLARLQKDTDLEKYQKVLSKAENYVRKYLFDSASKLFKEYNIASQVWLVLADVLPAEENKTVMLSSIKRFFPVKGIATPYMYHHIAEALFHTGLKAEAVDFIKAYWGEMIKRGADTFWEAFEMDNPEYSPYGSPIVNSYCHAWSCTPVYLVSKYL